MHYVLLIWIVLIAVVDCFTKVVVPAVYKEWDEHIPLWAYDDYVLRTHNYSVFLYQKTDPDKPNYIRNRGTEGGVYLRYIVDHYDDFPDVAVFVHADPHDHTLHKSELLEQISCINPNASYMSINEGVRCADPRTWEPIETWVEQCWRDTLRIIWGLQNNTEALNARLPTNKRIVVCFRISQQFIMSRAMVHVRPLSVWKDLLRIVNEQDVCHDGPPDYPNLFARQYSIGPEMPDIEYQGEQLGEGFGRHVQGGMMEHLAHVIFGHKELDMEFEQKEEDTCQNFLPNCVRSPCRKIFGPLFHELDVGQYNR